MHGLILNWDAQFVKELLRVRNNEISLRDFTMSEISGLIECMCVTWCNFMIWLLCVPSVRINDIHTLNEFTNGSIILSNIISANGFSERSLLILNFFPCHPLTLSYYSLKMRLKMWGDKMHSVLLPCQQGTSLYNCRLLFAVYISDEWYTFLIKYHICQVYPLLLMITINNTIETFE